MEGKFKAGTEVVIDLTFPRNNDYHFMSHDSLTCHKDNLAGKRYKIEKDSYSPDCYYGPIYSIENLPLRGFRYWIQEHLLIDAEIVACLCARCIRVGRCGRQLNTACPRMILLRSEIESSMDLSKLSKVMRGTK